MRSLRTNLAKTALALCLSVLPLSCDYTVEFRWKEEERGVEPANLVLYARPVETTRAAGEASIEEMETLRIVILRPDGSVEHNTFHTDCQDGSVYTFKVLPDEPKRILLIANEYPSFSGTLSAFGPESQGFEEAASQIAFGFDDQKSVPMTGIYNIPSIASAANAQHTFHVVRAATKFSFDFINNRPSDVVVSEVGLSSLARTSYLFPRLTRQGIWRFDESDGFIGDSYTYGGVLYPQWELWLKRLVDNQGYGTPTDRTGQVYSDIDGWILDYDIPLPSEQEVKTVISPDAPLEVGSGEEEALGRSFYYSESKNLMSGSAYLEGLEQAYYLTVTVADKNGEPRTFTRQMPNLRGLFRNTHVIVTVTFSTYGVNDEIYARIEPWTVVQEVDGTLEEENPRTEEDQP